MGAGSKDEFDTADTDARSIRENALDHVEYVYR